MALTFYCHFNATQCFDIGRTTDKGYPCLLTIPILYMYSFWDDC